jgi:hypothetical protein
METIKNMCANPTNHANPKTDINRSDKFKQILNDLGLEDIPDYDQLLSDVNDELAKEYELLNKLNINRLDKTDGLGCDHCVKIIFPNKTCIYLDIPNYGFELR